jgi:hypothetical protein
MAYLAEFGCIALLIWMHLQNKLAVSAPDLGLRGSFRDSQVVVEVALLHMPVVVRAPRHCEC